MRTSFAFASIMIAGLLAAPASAQDTERYRLERTDDGFVRMDVQTGHMSICEERAGQLICRSSVDERDSHRQEIDDLETRLDAVEQRLAAIERRGLISPDGSLPSEEDFERTLSFMERFFRRFLGIVQELDEDTPPDRT